MAKAKKTAFFCQNCGYESAKWMGQCPACREWNTFVEEPTAAKTPAGNQGLGSHSAAGRKPVHLTEISTGKEERIPTGIGELDRVLGGGIVPGSLTLVGADDVKIRLTEQGQIFIKFSDPHGAQFDLAQGLLAGNV